MNAAHLPSTDRGGLCVPEGGYLCIPLVLSVLKEVTENSDPQEDREEERTPRAEGEEEQDPSSLLLGLVTNTFQNVVERLAWVLRKRPEEEGRALCGAAGPHLGDFLQVVQTWGAAPSSPLQGVFSTLFAGVFVEIRHRLQKVLEIMVSSSIVCFLLGAV